MNSRLYTRPGSPPLTSAELAESLLAIAEAKDTPWPLRWSRQGDVCMGEDATGVRVVCWKGTREGRPHWWASWTWRGVRGQAHGEQLWRVALAAARGLRQAWWEQAA